jgi:hypothetical protein
MKDPTDREPPRPTVRDRVRRHLRKLVVAGSATGAAIHLAACPVVCDPLPPPLECAADPSMYVLLEHAWPSAAWTQVEGQWVVRVTVDVQLDSQDDPLALAGPPELLDATLLGETHTASHLEFTCVPHAGVTVVDVQVPTDCNGGASHLRFTMGVGEVPSADAYIPITGVDD